MSESPSAPKVFISHASEDKDRFVMDFARRLREKWGDAWVDTWEIGPGDSLVQRIFDKGIGQADAVIVVLSPFSVEKPWVKAELDVSKVREIEEGIRLIPVIIEACEVPTALRATRWVQIADLNSYDNGLDEIARAVHGISAKPPLGEPPAYLTASLPAVDGLAQQDSLVLRLLGDTAIELNARHFYAEGLAEEAASFGLTSEAVFESYEALWHQGLLGADRVPRQGQQDVIHLTAFGASQYLDAHCFDAEPIVRSVAAAIVNLGRSTMHQDDVAAAAGHPVALVRMVFDVLELNGLVELLPVTGGAIIRPHLVLLQRFLDAA